MALDLDEIKNALDMYLSGMVNRYHTHPDPRLRNAQDLTDAHSARMVKLLIVMFPELAHEAKLILAIILHDAGEAMSGDGPYRVKQMSTVLKDELDVIENDYLIKLLAYSTIDLELIPHYYEVLKLLDLLESFMFQTLQAPGTKGADSPLYQTILKRAAPLGKLGRAQALMNYTMKQCEEGFH